MKTPLIAAVASLCLGARDRRIDQSASTRSVTARPTVRPERGTAFAPR